MQISLKPETDPVPRLRGGFTLLEVLLVLAILIAIAAMVVPNIVGAADEANKDTTRLNIKAFEQAAQMYKIKNKYWPEGGTEDVVMLLMMITSACSPSVTVSPTARSRGPSCVAAATAAENGHEK